MTCQQLILRDDRCKYMTNGTALLQIRSEYAEQEKQFKVLHRDKYVPLKEAAAATSEQLEEERTRRRALQQEAQLLSQVEDSRVSLYAYTCQQMKVAAQRIWLCLENQLCSCNKHTLQKIREHIPSVSPS